VESKIGSRDIVTKTDQECQEIIKMIILKEFPSHKFLGEEDIAPGRDASIEATKLYANEVSSGRTLIRQITNLLFQSIRIIYGL